MSYHHVKGNQDKDHAILKNDAYLNVIADNIARNNTGKPLQIHSSTQVAVYVNGNYIPQRLTQHLRRHCHENDAAMKMRQDYKWDTSTYHDIHWEAHSSITKKLTYEKKSKHSNSSTKDYLWVL